MIQSMTGFGKADIELENCQARIEIRTLNSKNLDLNFRMPSAFKSNELSWRKIISSQLIRGKVDVSIQLQKNESHKSIQLNAALIKSYIEELQDISDNQHHLDQSKLLQIAVNLPEAIIQNEEELSKEDLNRLESGLKMALKHVLDFRTQEGNHLFNEFIINIDHISKLLDLIESIDSDRIEKLRERLLKAVSELEADYDKNRFEQELIYYIEKYDISEEKTRLKNHLIFFKDTLNTKNSNGKKLNFISQEIGREINTIGSKANYAEMQNMVVEMKDYLEKIKEQLLNIL